MSQEAEIMFELARQRREELFRTRVRTKTQEFYQRYRKQYEDMIAQGYGEYIPQEMTQFENDLNSVSELLDSDPAAAREVSMEIGSYVHDLWELGKEAMQTFYEAAQAERERARQEKEAQQNTTLARYYSILSEVEPIAANFAADELSKVKQSILSGEISTAQNLETRLGSVLDAAKEKATAWKNQKRNEQKSAAMVAQIEEQEKIFQSERHEDKTKAQALIDKLAKIKHKAAAGSLKAEEVKQQLSEISRESDEIFVGENVRREVVVAICKWFSAHDFTVSKPKLVDGNVVITAQRPSGNKAQFILRLDNKMFYRLDGYEGQSCLKDISAAKSDWESVYGIKLSDETIKWQNPDKILRRQTQTFTSTGGNA